MNHPRARFHRAMHRFALMAMMLMVCMPLLSRWQQAQHAEDMCLSEASRAALDGHAAHGHDPAGDNTPSPHDHTHNHDACGYCMLATRLLPVLALVLAVPLPLRPSHARAPAPFAPPAARPWPAHSPRGPPTVS